MARRSLCRKLWLCCGDLGISIRPPKFWFSFLHLTRSPLLLALLSAVRINGDGQEILYLAEGDNVRLGCPYILDPEDYGPSGLDIEWMQVNSEPSHRENVFLSYQDKRINHGNLPHLQQRVRFAASDPSQYDASINLMNLQVSDTATYECRVKKTTMATRKVIVTVQARPAVPLCWSEGHMAYGNDVVLKCFANGGTPPLSYNWAKISGHTHPYRAGSYHSQHTFQSELSYQESFHSSINQGVFNGDLVLKDISYEDNGLYQCTVANHVGYSVCVVEMKVSDSRRAGVIVGAVLGSLLLLGCLLLAIWALTCCCCGGAGGTRGAFGNSLNMGHISPEWLQSQRYSLLQPYSSWEAPCLQAPVSIPETVTSSQASKAPLTALPPATLTLSSSS
ncbi:PREDICTED: V-set and immunoglobulin domain-containing protein 8 [Myotis davidii]|uniref:V-set and immunoglobulin domain-containing protein 8 n=1 Tax=Myotis davidii TaxID=225400 RepID=UPI00076760FB|nr:PREDICTED: V-set and immunoglobulin domain-containing protein 8 [Myotis davidii]